MCTIYEKVGVPFLLHWLMLQAIMPDVNRGATDVIEVFLWGNLCLQLPETEMWQNTPWNFFKIHRSTCFAQGRSYSMTNTHSLEIWENKEPDHLVAKDNSDECTLSVLHFEKLSLAQQKCVLWSLMIVFIYAFFLLLGETPLPLANCFYLKVIEPHEVADMRLVTELCMITTFMLSCLNRSLPVTIVILARLINLQSEKSRDVCLALTYLSLFSWF